MAPTVTQRSGAANDGGKKHDEYAHVRERHAAFPTAKARGLTTFAILRSVIGDAATRRSGRRSGRTTLGFSQSLRGLRSSDHVAQRLHYRRPRGGGVRGAAAFAAMPEAM